MFDKVKETNLSELTFIFKIHKLETQDIYSENAPRATKISKIEFEGEGFFFREINSDNKYSFVDDNKLNFLRKFRSIKEKIIVEFFTTNNRINDGFIIFNKTNREIAIVLIRKDSHSFRKIIESEELLIQQAVDFLNQNAVKKIA